jgi:hypothetical protein
MSAHEETEEDMLTLTLVLSIVSGALLAFMGYRSFKLSMAVAGFVIGAVLGSYIYSFAWESLPVIGTDKSLWLYIFMVVAGAILALVSFRLYKAALFYVSALATAYVLMKYFLIIMAGGISVSAFIKFVMTGSRADSQGNMVGEIMIGDKGTVSELVGDMYDKIPGSTEIQKMMVVLGIALVVGAIVGFVVCLIQKPAIIVVTSVLGATLLSQGVCQFLESLDNVDFSADTVIKGLAVGPENIAVSTILFIVLLVIAIPVQLKTTRDID